MADRCLIAVAVGGTIGGIVLVSWLRKMYKKVIVWDFNHALLYKNGAFVKTLPAGGYWLWTPSDTITLLDNRRTTATIAGQEVVTADNVGIKLSLFLTYQIVDPLKASQQSQAWYQDIHAYTQLAARDLLSTLKIEEILLARSSLGDKMLEQIKSKCDAIGIEMIAVQIKDLILPAEVRKIFGDVLRAQKEGVAALERARGEQAALRSLANAARMLEGNPALMNLRILQSLAVQSGAVPPTLVLGMPGGFMPFGPHQPPHRDHPPGHKPPPPGKPGDKPPPDQAGPDWEPRQDGERPFPND